MSLPGVKTIAFRNALRQSLESKDWRSCAWARRVLAVECLQGWAGRKNPTGPTMLLVYCTIYPSAQHTKDMARFFQDNGLPPFNLVPIRNYHQEISANRLPRTDTQDRFWLLRGYNALDAAHWDHWSITHSQWGRDFRPNAQEAQRIVEDPVLFDAMLAQDWQRHEHFGDAFLWPLVVVQYHALWPDYSAIVQTFDTSGMNTFETFRAAHLAMRSSYLDPTPMERFDLP